MAAPGLPNRRRSCDRSTIGASYRVWLNSKAGSKAPAFTLPTDSGEKLTLASLAGKKVVLYFYPKADTPGCTREACGFRDELPSFSGVDAVILGASPDSVKAVAKFKEKYSLPFTLLADSDHAVAESYGVWVEKMRCGKLSLGIDRSTFIIGKDGKISKVFRNVKVDGHTAQVLEALRAL